MTFNQEFAGPPLGALLLAVAAALPFFVDAASVAIAAGIVFTIKGGVRPEPHEAALVAGFKQEVVEGLRWVWGQPVLRDIMLIAAVMSEAAEGLCPSAWSRRAASPCRTHKRGALGSFSRGSHIDTSYTDCLTDS